MDFNTLAGSLMFKVGVAIFLAFLGSKIIKKLNLPNVTGYVVVGLLLGPSLGLIFKGYGGFPASICASINEEVVHGIPSNRKLKNGDIVSIDIGACYKGYHGDSAWTYPVGKISPEKQFLLDHTEQSLYEGIKVIKAGARVGDIGNAISKYIENFNLGVVRELVGHGIGNKLHEAPDVPNYGNPKTGPLLKEGMVIAVEPMIYLGTREVYIKDD